MNDWCNLVRTMNENDLKTSKNSSTGELSVRERMELDKEIRLLAREIRKEHPFDWREILKSTSVYKRRHNIIDSDNQDDETKETSKTIKDIDSKNKKFDTTNFGNGTRSKDEANSNFDKNNKFDNFKNELRKHSDLINDFFDEIHNNGFLSFEKREKIIIKYSDIYKTISKLDKCPNSQKEKIFSEFDDLKRFLKIYKDLIDYINLSDTPMENDIRKINEKSLDLEINQNEDFFKEISDVNKKRAIVIDEKNVRVNAGAGTGKTFTIQNKVKYLIERKGVAPDKILCLCYTVKGAADLDDKVNQNLDNDNEVKACTFHEFCRSVASDCKRSRVTDRTILETAILNYTKNLDDRKLNKLIEYFGYYINSPIDDEDIVLMKSY